ncbi:MAG: PEP-CTERM sorting domain-containing protein [Armatimonadota bacterium]|nr:PEP-CTERM sorting domain-containing protein [Armatimonadota bacterium]MDW8143336.1 PEP-CTERM sorting domain-containing protein [Armatimonadota bacterium]
MSGLLRLKKLATAATVCLVASFAVFGTANATPLSNTNVSWNDFASTWSPTDVQVLVSPFTFKDGASGKVVSIAYLSKGGSPNGKWVYSYQVIFESGQGSITAIALGPASAPVTVGVSNSFQTSKPSGNTQFSQFRPNGVSTIAGIYDSDTQTYTWFFTTGVSAGKNSVVFGYFSDQAPTSVQANLFKGLAELNSKPMVLAASPEPSVLSLLTIGLLGVAVRRRRKNKDR